MRGEFIGVWAETCREIWLPLIEQPLAEDEVGLPEDIFCELYRALEPALSPRPSTEDLADIIANRFYARRTLELAINWAYKHDAALRLPYQDNLSALIHEPSFKQAAGQGVFSKARVINTLGNRAVHSHRTVPESDALAAPRELFHVAYWFARTYARAARPAAGLAFDLAALPRPRGVRGDRKADCGSTAHSCGRPPGTRRETRVAARGQGRARRGTQAPAG